MAEAERGGLLRSARPGNVLRRVRREDTVDDRDPVEHRQRRQAPSDRGQCEMPVLLQVPQVQLDVRALRGQRDDPMPRAPTHPVPQVRGVGVPGRTAVAGQKHRERQRPRIAGQRTVEELLHHERVYVHHNLLTDSVRANTRGINRRDVRAGGLQPPVESCFLQLQPLVRIGVPTMSTRRSVR